MLISELLQLSHPRRPNVNAVLSRCARMNTNCQRTFSSIASLFQSRAGGKAGGNPKSDVHLNLIRIPSWLPLFPSPYGNRAQSYLELRA